jgi:prepilin-type N-terminal cleavage/methylation domain-containing protein
MAHARGRQPTGGDVRPALRAGGASRRRPPAPAAAHRSSTRRRAAFSLVELVIVVIILGIVASIALRRVSRHAEAGAANAAAQDVGVLQQAVERYRAEHGGTYPSAAQFAEQLTGYTDVFGAVSPTRTAPHIYGPYVRAIPPVPLGPARGSNKVATAAAPDVGWIYDEAGGEIRPNE